MLRQVFRVPVLHVLAAHGLALLAGLIYVTLVFRHTALGTTGAMFVAPVILILAVHLLIARARQASFFGAAAGALRSTIATTAVLLLGACLLVFLAPEAAQADLRSTAGELGAVSVCLIILFAVLLILAGFAYVVFRILLAVFRLFRPKKPKTGAGDGQIREAASLVIVLTGLAGLALEGMPHGIEFDRSGTASATVFVGAPPQAVWAAIGKAASPGLPLPFWLTPFAHVLSVDDEGAEIGSRRIVHLRGREGAGELALRVSSRGPHAITWSVTGDTTPFAAWATGQDISYQITPVAGGTQLIVTARYQRLLSPAWIFSPYMNRVIGAAMQVLAQDKKARAEALALSQTNQALESGPL